MKVENRRRIISGVTSALNSPIRRVIFFESPKRFNKYVEQGQTVLDLGCAVGYFSMKLAEKVGDQGKVIAIDLEDFFIDKLRKRAARHPELHVEPYVASAVDLSMIEDESIDYILAHGLLCSMPIEDQNLAISEMKRVLKPGGKISLYAGVESDKKELNTRPAEFTKGVLKQEVVGSYVNQTRWNEILLDFNGEPGYRVKPMRFSQALVIKREQKSSPKYS